MYPNVHYFSIVCHSLITWTQRKMRDELAHNVFLMLQECNKFREHQAREVLIELLEQQLAQRLELTAELKTTIARADALLLMGENGDDQKIVNKSESVAATTTKQSDDTSLVLIKQEDISDPMNEG